MLYFLGCAIPTPPTDTIFKGEHRQLLTQPTIGINEAISVPRALVLKGKVSAEEIARRLEKEAALTQSLGAQTVRANSHTYPYLNYMDSKSLDWKEHADRYVRIVQGAGLEPVMVIGPWPGIQTGMYTQDYLPKDMEGYSQWVSEVVERYDADGLSDMPNLKAAINYWEVDNEPDLHNHRPPRGAPQFKDPSLFETPLEYATILIETSQAIRSANADAEVIFGGLASVLNQHGQDYLKSVLDVPEVKSHFDILSVHCYIDKPTPDAIIKSVDFIESVLPNTPIWLTETGVASDQRRPWMTENKQAELLFEIYTTAYSSGYDRVYWHTLRTPEITRGPFASHGLLRSRSDNFEQKPAAMVYKSMSEIISKVEWVEMNPTDFKTNTGYFSISKNNSEFSFPDELNLPHWHSKTSQSEPRQ